MSYLDDTGLAYFWTKIKAYVSSFLTWANIQNKPSTFAPSAHSHGNITNAGELGTASRAVVTDGNKKVSVSSVTSTELGYLSGVTSNVQTQLNGKAASSDIPVIPSLSRTISGSGNAITDITVSGHAITATKGATYITSSGSITGNAATATKLGTSTVGDTDKPIYLNAGTATAVNSALRTCYGGVESEAVSNTYFKIGSGSISGSYNHLKLYILVQNITGSQSCIWGVWLASGATAGVYSDGRSYLFVNDGYATDKFIVAYKSNSGGTLNFELYVKETASYQNHRFTVIQECWRNSQKVGNILTLYNQLTTTGTATIASGYTALTTTNGTVSMNISGNAATVTGTAGTSLLAWNTENTVYTVGGHAIKVKLPANPNTNTTYTFATGDSNGQIKVTPSGGSAQNISVKGLGSAAYTASTAYVGINGVHYPKIAVDNTASSDPTSTVIKTGVEFIENNSQKFADIYCERQTDGSSRMSLRCFSKDRSKAGYIYIHCNKANTIYHAYVGSSPANDSNNTAIATTAWVRTFCDTTQKYMKAVSVTGSGNAVTAASLANGTLTLTKGTTFLTSHQSLANYVTTNTEQTVSGKKTFTGGTYFNNHIHFGSTAAAANTISKDVADGALYLTVEGISQGATMILHGRSFGSTEGWFYLEARKGSTARQLNASPTGNLYWNGQTVQTSSDERLKTPMTAVPDDILDGWEDVEWGAFKFLDAVEEKGASARFHVGLIAQAVDRVFLGKGLDVKRYGILCHDERPEVRHDILVTDREAYTDENGVFHEAVTHNEGRVDEAVDLWMVRYTEALCMEAAYQRRENARLKKRVADLEERLAALELKIS